MANIIGLQQQQDALKEIRSVLKDLVTTNNFLNAENPSGKYTISFTDGTGKKLVTELSGSKEEVDKLVSRYKAETRDYIVSLADENRIALDPEDKEILGIDGNPTSAF